MFDISPDFTPIPIIRPYYNIGCLFDILTGKFVKGKHGENILNGGLGPFTGVVGIGNQFKTTIMLYMLLKAMSRFSGSRANGYDCEINVQHHALKRFVANIPEFKGEDILDSGKWLITDKTMYYGNEWYEIWKKYILTKIAGAKKFSVTTPFLDRDGINLIEILMPTFSYVDSLTEFITEDVVGMSDKNELGDSGANTIFMRQGISKLRLIQELPSEIAKGNNPVLMTAQIGKEIPMDPRAAPVVKLKYLKNNDKIKGVTDKFTFATNQCYQCSNSSPLQNDTTKGPEYPRYTGDDLKGDTDLSEVTLMMLRSKTGPSGMPFKILVSQADGVLPSLTEFHYIKTCDRFGIDGSLQNYWLDLMPDVKLSRTTVRGKLHMNEKLQRAVNITSEMCQMFNLWHDLPKELICTPRQLYQDLIARGYDWDVLLSTRGWWTYDNDKHPVPFLSTMDLLEMRTGAYHPYWMPKKDASMNVSVI